MAEEKFEKSIIKKLVDEGWTYNQELSGSHIAKLEEHWRVILNQNNRIKLQDQPLSNNEFDALRLELNKIKTPYDAQLVLAGAGNIGTLPLTRDDGTQLEIEIFYGDEVAGGHSEYEIVNQIIFDNLPNSLSHNRRIDLLMLINGLPVAHIEEKDEALQNQWNALEQLKKYDDDGMYLGLMSFVQVQFILSQHSAHYLARPKNSMNYNHDFVFGWRNDQGQDITDSMDFIHQAMGIPALHRLVTVNMIPDASNDNLMVMRSYQIQATRAILDRMHEMTNNHFIEKEGGYIWHTTGSGKTVTSFKVAQLLAAMPQVRHVLFIVDRVDLVNQTYENFKSYAYKTFENRIQIVDGYHLKKELKSSNHISNVFLITVQGLNKAVKSGLKSDQRMVILMDEAHRSANGEAVTKIKKALPKTTWFGFTGTPNFYSDEVQNIKTSRNISTYDIFGQRLHQYTIKDAIGDGNVLGFNVTYYKTAIEAKNEKNLSDQNLEKEVYTSSIYRELVVNDILKHWDENASGPLNFGERQANQFQGMLAVSGKQAAVAYYEIFKRLAPNLRVAVTFSRDEDNGLGSSDLQASLKSAMTDYTKTFNTMDFINSPHPERAYLNDITKRLARKKPYNHNHPEDILHLIIVSDQLLTGFDSKYINIIYFDKILAEGLLIQGMSRTNRIYDQNAKPYGKVRFFRKGELMEENVKNALVIYTKGGNDTIDDAKKPRSNKETQELFNDDILAPKMAQQIELLQPQIIRLQELAGPDFSQEPLGEKAQSEFVLKAAEVIRDTQKMVQQGYALGSNVEDYDDEGQPTGKKVKLMIDSSNQLSALQARLNDVNAKLPNNKQIDLFNINIDIEKYRTQIIDYDYLVELLNNYQRDKSPKNLKAIEDHIATWDEPSKRQIHEIVSQIQDGTIIKPFTKESLKDYQKEIGKEINELLLYDWANENHYDVNDIFEAYKLYLPGVALHDNPKLDAKVKEIIQKLHLNFFEKKEFADSLMAVFAETVK